MRNQGVIFLLSVVLVWTASPCVYAAQSAEGAVVTTGPLSLADVKPEVSSPESGYHYLADIEKQLRELEEKNLLLGIQGSESLLLEDCLQMAIERHLPIEIAEDKISLYRRKLIKAVRDLFPSLRLLYEHNKGFKLQKADSLPGEKDNQRFRSERIRASLSQPVFRGGSLWNKVNEERANLRSAKAEYDKVFLDLLVEVARAFFNLSKAQTMLEFKENIVVEADRALELSEEKMKATLISEIEHLNVQSQQSQLQHDLEAAREDIALALVDLQKALHLDVNEPVQVVTLEGVYTDTVQREIEKDTSTAKKDEKEQEEELDSLLEKAYQDRPEFIIQRSKVEAARYKQKQAVGGWFPQVSFQFERGQKAEAYIEDDNNPPWDVEQRIVLDTRWNVAGSTVRHMYDKNKQGTGVEATEPAAGIGKDGYYDRKNTVSVSVLDGLDQFTKTKETEIAYKEALLELELSEKDIVSEVKESFYNYNRALIQMRSSFKRLAYRQKLVDLAKHRSEINEIQLSEYIQAEIDLINERDNLYKAMIDYYIAKISLSKAIGSKEYMPREA